MLFKSGVWEFACSILTTHAARYEVYPGHNTASVERRPKVVKELVKWHNENKPAEAVPLTGRKRTNCDPKTVPNLDAVIEETEEPDPTAYDFVH